MIYVFDYATLKLIWWLFIGVLLIGFAVLDGFDLGVSALLPFVGRSDDERRVMLNAIGPTWEGNQVWLITAGGAIFAAWPLVYATAFSGFYVALILTLFTLFFRPVGIEYRGKRAEPRWRNGWDWGLCVGGAVPALIFGVAFGNLLQGVPFHFDSDQRVYYTGSFFGLLNPFALLSGVVSLGMLTMHGAIFLQLRTDGAVQARARRAALVCGIVFLAAFAAAGIWVALGLSAYHIVAMPPAESAFMPLAKTVERLPGGWLGNYARYPAMALAPVACLSGRRAWPRRVAGRPCRIRLCALQHRRCRRGAHRGARPVSVHHALVERPAEQPHGVRRGFEPPHAADHVLGRHPVSADHARLYRLGLSRHARNGDRTPGPRRRIGHVLNSYQGEAHVVFHLDPRRRTGARLRHHQRDVARSVVRVRPPRRG